ncbi:MmpS family transport accessory protein [Actinoplanes sp. TRM 88003]|uniref:MmpS family transport accessory protein n=1 Tax=Paractinoplanes aksuensis TaxID=2939490 RepID=A0ABT1DUC3_9ACTN|nr:MmpS family transport accessory protein [Actinoplanes aksuensis]MCO8273296.1 MmpS family transport accessory protein [Actinoplanes aksuensis]
MTNVDPWPVPDDIVPPEAPPTRARRGLWFVLLIPVLAVVLLACAVGFLFRQSDSGSAAIPPPPPPSSPIEVVYVVASNNDGDVASVEYTDQDRDIIRKGEVKLPWRITFEYLGDKPPLVLMAQRKQGGTGAVTCSITVGGKELTTAVQRGRYAAPQCSA